MSDLIERVAVLEDLEKRMADDYVDAARFAEYIRTLPSAETERKKGEWIEISWSELDSNVCCTSFSIQSAKCSICGKYHTTPFLYSLDYFPYCPNCGAEMSRGE